MPKLDPTVKQETRYIASFVLIFSVLMQAVFLVIGKWNSTVLLGNLLSAAAAIANFLLLGLTVQRAVTKDEKDARSLMKLSQTYRLLGLLVIAVIGFAVPVFHPLAVILPLLFPRIAIAVRPLFKKD
ncbi:MAG: hypothetical protein E7553_06120 [Ruminococcaceae bacterium]|nr:hypothetical protein [Oscillospiraceae bacterium]